jgi:hypothetical protein
VTDLEKLSVGDVSVAVDVVDAEGEPELPIDLLKHGQGSLQVCQIFHALAYQNGENIPNNQEIYQMSIIYVK